MKQTINSMSASDFIVNNFNFKDLPSFTHNDLRIYKQLIEYKDEAIFKDANEANFFFQNLNSIYTKILTSISNLIDGSNSKFIIDSKSINLLVLTNLLLTNKIFLEPMTKLFIEDLVNLIYKNETRSLNHYGLLLSRPIGNYEVSHRASIELDVNLGSKITREGKVPNVTNELSTLLSKIGTLRTLDVIKCLMGILINYYYLRNRHELDTLLTQYTATLRTHATALPKAP